MLKMMTSILANVFSKKRRPSHELAHTDACEVSPSQDNETICGEIHLFTPEEIESDKHHIFDNPSPEEIKKF